VGAQGSYNLRRRMARRSLRPQLNQIRTWVRQGRTDAWIAHQLEVPVQQVDAFKREHELLPEGADAAADSGVDVDLRAADDALIAAEMEAEEAARAEAEEAARRAEEEARAAREAAGEDEDDDEDSAPKRRRGRRGGRGRSRRSGPTELEGPFDHGEEGYGLWLDPAVADSAVYAEHWAGHRGVTVIVEEDQIVIRRAGEDEPDSDADSD
jgi:hypothetical protein